MPQTVVIECKSISKKFKLDPVGLQFNASAIVCTS